MRYLLIAFVAAMFAAITLATFDAILAVTGPDWPVYPVDH